MKLGGRKCIVYLAGFMQIRDLLHEKYGGVKVPCTRAVWRGSWEDGKWVED